VRPRDVRAIVFCGASTLTLLVGSQLLTRNILFSLALAAAYAAWVLTRPRMLRIFHRLRGDPDWSGYFDNDGDRLNARREPGTAAPPPHPAERT
jgi:hypothetical protein